MTNQPGSFENFGRKIDETVSKAAPRVEEELKKIIAFLNDEVVPKVRENSSKGLRVAADQLSRLAEHLDRTTGDRTTRDRTTGDPASESRQNPADPNPENQGQSR
ncbi:MAG: hypothetical protein JOZ83_17455 [Silvibacterium sp.]|nr:hypothetical protein [Silvibacterium sp.]